MRLLAIDPGPERSAWVIFDTDECRPVEWSKDHNDDVRDVVHDNSGPCRAVAIEMVASYGMAVGADVFETCVEIGRFIECWIGIPEPIRVYRRDCKMHICGSPRANDSNIRQALIDRYGPSKAKAIGLKASPGPLYGMTGDCWAALAVAITAAETRIPAPVRTAA